MRENNFEISEILLQHNANPNIYDDREPPLYYAVENNNLKIAELLLHHGANQNLAFQDEPMHRAARNDNLQFVELLARWDPNQQTINGAIVSAVQYATKIEIVEIILHLKPTKDNLNYSLGSAVKNNNFEFAELLIKSGAYPKTEDEILLFEYLNDKNIEHDTRMIELLIDSTEPEDLSEFFNDNPLFIPLDIVEILFERGVKIGNWLGVLLYLSGSLLSTDYILSCIRLIGKYYKYKINERQHSKKYNLRGLTPLSLAAFKETEILEELINQGADVNGVSDGDGSTPIFESSDDLIPVLIKHGADVNFVTELGETVLGRNVEDEESKTVKILLDNGADVTLMHLTKYVWNLETSPEIKDILNRYIMIIVVSEHERLELEEYKTDEIKNAMLEVFDSYQPVYDYFEDFIQGERDWNEVTRLEKNYERRQKLDDEEFLSQVRNSLL